MALLPTAAAIVDAAVTAATTKLNFSAIRDVIADLLGTDSSNKELARSTLGAADSSEVHNLLINPNGEICQISAGATTDDAYMADGWYALTQTGAVSFSLLADPEDGYTAGVRITQSQATAQRFGYAQIIEGRRCKHLRGKTGYFYPRIKCSSSQPIRYAILGWTGTENAVTSDVVNNWASGAYTAGNFFLVSNISVLAVGSQTPAAATWTSLAAISGALGSTFNNIIVMAWTEGTAAQNVTLDFDWNQFGRGAYAQLPEFKGVEHHHPLCQRYFNKSYDIGTAPGTITIVGARQGTSDNTGTYAMIGYDYPAQMWTVPSVTIFNPATGTSGEVYDTAGASRTAQASYSQGSPSTSYAFAIVTVATSANVPHTAHFVAAARL